MRTLRAGRFRVGRWERGGLRRGWTGDRVYWQLWGYVGGEVTRSEFKGVRWGRCMPKFGRNGWLLLNLLGFDSSLFGFRDFLLMWFFRFSLGFGYIV